MDLFYCEEHHCYHDRTAYTGDPIVAEQANRDVKAANGPGERRLRAAEAASQTQGGTVEPR